MIAVVMAQLSKSQADRTLASTTPMTNGE